MRKFYLEKIGPEMQRQREIVATPAYQSGDPETVTARYRIHFRPALNRREHYEQLMTAMHAGFVRQGKGGIVKAPSGRGLPECGHFAYLECPGEVRATLDEFFRRNRR